jgi:predicted dienelactone hydrolase
MRRFFATMVMTLAPVCALALPDPTTRGPFPVGFRSVTLTRTQGLGAPYDLDTSIWYPAVEGTGSAEGAFLRNADVAKGRHPTIAFSHGLCGLPGQSPFYVEMLASRGYIVAAPPHPGSTTAECFGPGGSDAARSYANRPGEISFVLDELLRLAKDRTSPFFRHVHPKRLGVSGHSFGGQTTLRVAGSDRRIKTAVALAPAPIPSTEPDPNIAAPALVITGDLDSLTPFETAARPSYALLDGPRALVRIEATGHCAFIFLCTELFCGTGCESPPALSTAEANALVLRYTIPFIERYLGRKAAYRKLLLQDSLPAGLVVEASELKVRRKGARP